MNLCAYLNVPFVPHDLDTDSSIDENRNEVLSTERRGVGNHSTRRECTG